MRANSKVVSYTKLSMSFIALIAGIILLFVGMLIPPAGEIHHTVLVAFGEAITFSAAILGIHFSYASKIEELENELSKMDTEKGTSKKLE